MTDLGRVYRFRDHAVAGVNWRPTPFVDEVPSSRVCGLCRMIARRTVLLPCEHTLCESCHVASSQDCSGKCPLDQEPFEQAECSELNLSTRKVNSLKVYCWNEEYGCQFEGALEDLLQHYEKECAFHAVECSRCGAQVLHRELSRHCLAGSSAGAATVRARVAPSKSAALTLQDVTASLEEFKSLLKDANHEQLLLAIQSQINTLTEEVRKHTPGPVVSTRERSTSVNEEVAQVVAPIPSTVWPEPASRQNPIDEARPSSTCSQEVLAPPKPHAFADSLKSVLLSMRKTGSEEYPQYAFECKTDKDIKCSLHVTTPLPVTRTWREPLGTVKYDLTLENLHKVSLVGQVDHVATITVLHTNDAYFVLNIYNNQSDLQVTFEFHGMFDGSSSSAPCVNIQAYNWIQMKMGLMLFENKTFQCPSHGNSCIRLTSSLLIQPDKLPPRAFLKFGKVKFEIELSHCSSSEAGHSNA